MRDVWKRLTLGFFFNPVSRCSLKFSREKTLFICQTKLPLKWKLINSDLLNNNQATANFLFPECKNHSGGKKTHTKC